MYAPIMTVGFDAWGTLVNYGQEKPDARYVREPVIEVLKAFGITFEQFQTAYRPSKDISERLSEIAQRHIGPLERIALVAMSLGVKPSDLPIDELAAACEIMLDRIEETPIVLLDPEAPESLAKLRENGTKLGIVSNLGVIRADYMRRMFQGFSITFDIELYSDETGLCKPSPAVFDALCTQAGSQPKQTLFLGDNLHADFYGPIAAGMQAMLIGEHPDPAILQMPTVTAALKIPSLL
jgi:FMN phosphatase YigB (HAD superfamily)